MRLEIWRWGTCCRTYCFYTLTESVHVRLSIHKHCLYTEHSSSLPVYTCMQTIMIRQITSRTGSVNSKVVREQICSNRTKSVMPLSVMWFPYNTAMRSTRMIHLPHNNPLKSVPRPWKSWHIIYSNTDVAWTPVWVGAVNNEMLGITTKCKGSPIRPSRE